MSSNTQVIVIKDDSSSVLPHPSSKSSLRRRKPWRAESVETTQLNRRALLDQIRNRPKKNYECRCRQEPSPRQVVFGKKALNQQLSKSVNDVKEAVEQLGPMVQRYRKLASSQVLAVPVNEVRVKFRSSRAHTLNDLSKAADLTADSAISEEQEKDDESKMCKVVEIIEKPQSDDSKTSEVAVKPEGLVEKSSKNILKRQLSKSVNDISISGLRVVGSEKIALSQIWSVPTNCGCCEPGKEGECKRLKGQASTVKPKTPPLLKNEEKPAESKKLEASEMPKVVESVPAKTTEPEKPKNVEVPKAVPATPAKTSEIETSKPSEILKTQEDIKESTKPAIPANPAKATESVKPKVAEVPKPTVAVKETTKQLIPAKPAVPVLPKATPTNATEVVDDANIIVKVLTWMGFWSTANPAEPTTTTATTTTTAAAKATTTTAPITATTAATVTVPTTSTAKKESPPEPPTNTKPESKPEDAEWVELQVPVVPREGTAKDATESSVKSTATLYLNVLVEVGSGLISITPVASYELLIKASVVLWDVEENLERAEEEAKKEFVFS